MVNSRALFIRLLLVVAFLWICSNAYAEGLTNSQREKISSEISMLFEKSIKAGESFDIDGITGNVNDTLKAGFIDNGIFFNAFDELMTGFNEGVKGIRSQKMNVTNKRITILSDNVALVTASGNYQAALENGRTLSGRFAWTFVYSKINEKWKIIHSHMSNPE